jgi:hypothetical protein
MESEETKVETDPKPNSPRMSLRGAILAGVGIGMMGIAMVQIIKILATGSFQQSDEISIAFNLTIGTGLVWSSVRLMLKSHAEYLAELLKAQNAPEPKKPTP